jgi:hypothetical protein
MLKFKNIGKTKTVFYKNGKLKKNEIDWTLNTDNKNGLDLNINMNDDGNNMHYHQYLTNRELEELLKKPVIDKSLEDRLIDDFNPYDNNQYDNNPYDNNLFQSQSFQSSQPLMIMSNKNSKTIRPKIIKIKLCTRKKNHHKHRHHHNRTISNRNRNRSNKHKKRSYSNTTSM